MRSRFAFKDGIITIAIASMFMSGAAFAADAAKAKAIFTENKCNKCHSIDAEGIKKAEDGDEDGKSAPDLSGAGKDGDVTYFMDWLQKKNKGHNGKAHLKKFKGTDDELKILADWFVSLDKGEAPSKLAKKK